MNQWFLRLLLLLLCLLIVIPCRVTTLVANETEPISRRTGDVLRNILGMETYKHHIVTSYRDKGFGRVVYGWVQEILRRYFMNLINGETFWGKLSNILEICVKVLQVIRAFGKQVLFCRNPCHQPPHFRAENMAIEV